MRAPDHNKEAAFKVSTMQSLLIKHARAEGGILKAELSTDHRPGRLIDLEIVSDCDIVIATMVDQARPWA